MRRKRRKVVFETPEEFEEEMYQYLDMVDEVNKPRFVVYNLITGDSYETKEDAYKEGYEDKDLKSEFEKVPVYDMVRPTLSGFCAYAGTSMSRYHTAAKTNERYAELHDWFITYLENEVEQLLLNPMNRNSSGAKMVAINRHKWSDKTEQEVTGGQAVTIVYDIPETKD